MRRLSFVGIALTALSLLSLYQESLQAAETCPIYSDITDQTEATPVLQTWVIDGAPTSTLIKMMSQILIEVT